MDSIIFKRKINAHGGSNCTTIPKEVMAYLDLKKDDEINIVADCKSKSRIAYFYKA
jgi:antitoxin component of MazEF toxin-antitoxin module